ncbi:hypothetical protein EXIGLDRAFT_747824 [Exidia glandulosa HHB12029]|uniref:Uncharacterized protein n=1 Tax=Exidia glandulosa HHB12029 TaxID=1314781 RepID=A0A165KBL1_EXIGL|nr:hypothetical protein EXIGLDRAFT_747824 [Exidia glandulosa HHB12029]
MERLLVPLISKIQDENYKIRALLLAGASGELSGSLITEEELETLAAVVEKALQYLTGENSALRVAISERRVADSALLNIASVPWAIPGVPSQPSIGSSSHLRSAPQLVPAAADPGAVDASSLGSSIAAAQSLSSVNNGGDLPVYDWEESLGEGIW